MTPCFLPPVKVVDTMMRVPPMLRESRSVLAAWGLSALVHAAALVLVIALFQDMRQIAPHSFHLTISLIEPLDPASDTRSPPTMDGLASPVPAGDSSPPATTVAHRGEAASQLVAANHEQSPPYAETATPTLPVVPSLRSPKPFKVAEQPRPPQSPVAPGVPSADESVPIRESLWTPALQEPGPQRAIGNSHAEVPAALAELDRAQGDAAELPVPPFGEATVPATAHALDQSIEAASVSSPAPVTAETPFASPNLPDSALFTSPSPLPIVAREEGELAPLMAARHSAFDSGSLHTDNGAGANRAHISPSHPSLPATSTQAKSPTDYSWLQQALFRRLDDLKRASRPSVEEAEVLRVLVRAVVSNRGELMESEIVTSSGQHHIDQEAMKLVQRAFPMSMDRELDRPQIAMRIPITFFRN